MIDNKDSFKGPSKILVIFSVCMAFGLALPAYGQEKTPVLVGPVEPKAFNTGRTGADAAAINCKMGPVIGEGAAARNRVTTSDKGNPFSFAVGCNAVAGTDGSLAIGEGAKARRWWSIKGR